jgi:hypothetical protein
LIPSRKKIPCGDFSPFADPETDADIDDELCEGEITAPWAVFRFNSSRAPNAPTNVIPMTQMA